MSLLKLEVILTNSVESLEVTDSIFKYSLLVNYVNILFCVFKYRFKLSKTYPA